MLTGLASPWIVLLIGFLARPHVSLNWEFVHMHYYFVLLTKGVERSMIWYPPGKRGKCYEEIYDLCLWFYNWSIAHILKRWFCLWVANLQRCPPCLHLGWTSWCQAKKMLILGNFLIKMHQVSVPRIASTWNKIMSLQYCPIKTGSGTHEVFPRSQGFN